MPTFTIRFRGVGVLVANSQPGVVTEVLFPMAEKHPPDGQDDGIFEEMEPDEDHYEPWLKRNMKHADKSPAHEHFAGALLVGSLSHVELPGCRVQLKGGSGSGAPITGGLLHDIPPLDEIVRTDPLRLLANHDDDVRVATRFLIDGDSIAADESSRQEWIFDSPKGTAGPHEYFLEAVLTIDADELEFEIFHLNDLPGTDPFKTIKMDATRNELYFYNFDVKNPSKLRLKKRDDAKPDTTDDDFKWVYKLFENQNNEAWPLWLGGEKFPAPKIPARGDVEFKTVSVSTCFETVWTGDDA